jgi:hypothetical protein
VKVLYYDCFAGVAGDMHLGALLDLGVEETYLRNGLGALALPGYRLEVRRERRRGVAGTRVEVVTDDTHHPPPRGLGEVSAIIEDSALPPAVTARSLAIFRRLAEAEAAVHGVPVGAVHFHEIGAVDALVDVVGAALALDRLAPERVLCSTVELGGGTVDCAHGRLPVPAPATEALLLRVPTRRGGIPFEATTPTGAAILATVVDRFTDRPALSVERVGYGLGRRDGPLPNALRALWAEAADPTQDDGLTLLECNIDDMNPELYDYALERLFEGGALDAWLAPVFMKKGRPAAVLAVLCPPALAGALTDVMLAETTTLGVRRQTAARTALARIEREVATRFGPIPVKVAAQGHGMAKTKPEYEACKRAARAHGVPIGAVYEEVWRCLDAGRQRE